MLMKVASRSRLREQKKKQREQSVFALFLANASTIVEIRSLFRWATEVLRRHVIEELNILFRRLGIASSISVSGLPSPEFILDLRDRMQRGEIDFAEASKITAPPLR